MKEYSSKNKLIARNTLFLYVRLIFVLFVSLYTTRVVLKTLGVEDYGVYNVVSGFVSLFSFFNASMSLSIQRFYNYKIGKYGAEAETMVYNTSLRIQILLAVIILLILETLGLWYVNKIMVIPEDRILAANIVYQCSVVSLIFVVLQIPYGAAIMAHEKMDYYAFVGILDVFLRLLIVIVLPFVSYDKLVLYGSLSLFVSIFNFCFYYVYSKNKFKYLRLNNVFDKEEFTSLLKFTGWNLLDMFAFTTKSQGGTLLINVFFGPVINAARGISMQIMSAIQSFTTNVTTAFRPQLVESYAHGDFCRVKNMMYTMSKFAYMSFYLLSVPIVLEIDYILSIWLGDIIPEYTVSFTILCLADMLLCSLNSPLSYVSQAVGVIKLYNIVRGFVIISIIPISWWLLHFFETPLIVYWVSIALVVINQPVSMVLLHRIFDYSYIEYLKVVILPCLLFSILTIILPVIFHYLIISPIVRLILVSVSTVFSALIVGYFFVLTKSERLVALNYVNGFIHQGR